MMQEGIVYFVANCILEFMLLFAADLVCERRFPLWIQLPIEALAGYLICVSMNMCPVYSAARFFVGAFTIIAVNALLHRDRLRYKVFVAILSLLCMTTSEIIFMTIMPRDAAVSGELYQANPVALYTMYLFVNAVVLSVMVVVMRYFHKRYRDSMNAKQWLLYPIFPISQVASLMNFAMDYIHEDFNLLALILTIVAYVLADIALIVTIRMTANNARLQARNEILEEQVDFQKDYYAQLSASYEGVRKMRHDIDNHLYTMQALLSSGKTEEASAYAKSVAEQDSVKIHFANCRNTVVASYLEKKSEDLEALGIAFEEEVSMPAELGISNPDLICVLGNLLNNAQEAVLAVPQGEAERNITLKTRYQKPYLSISCTNPVAEQPAEQKRRRIPELERGVGMTILEEMTGRYDGQMKTSRENGLYRADLVLKGENENADGRDL